MHRTLSTRYTSASFTHTYVLTFIFCKTVYAAVVDMPSADALMAVTRLDKASRGAGMALRFRPTNAIKLDLINRGAKVLCSEKYFNEVYKNCKYNRGEVAEMLVTELMFHQKWEKDSVPFTMGGDIVADGVAYQHKHQGATFCNEKTLRNLVG